MEITIRRRDTLTAWIITFTFYFFLLFELQETKKGRTLTVQVQPGGGIKSRGGGDRNKKKAVTLRRGQREEDQ